MARRKISERMVRSVLTRGKSDVVKGFKSKAGKEFSAGLVWDGDKGRVGFWFPERAPSPAGRACPKCRHGTVIRGKKSYGCSAWREGCDFRAPFEP